MVPQRGTAVPNRRQARSSAVSARWTSTQRPVVVARAERVDQPLGAALEAAAQQPLGLAEQLVDAERDVAVGGLDQAVGVEQHRVARRSDPADARRTRRPRSGRAPDPSLSSTTSGPSRRAAGRPAGGRPCGSRSRRCAGRGRGGPRWRSPRPSPGAAGSRWRRAGTPPAAARRAGRRRRRRAAATAGAGLLALAGHVDHDELEPVVGRPASATTKSPANGVPPAERSAASAQPAGGQRRQDALALIRSRRSTSIDSPSGPATPSRVRRNEVSRMRSAIANDARTRARRCAG